MSHKKKRKRKTYDKEIEAAWYVFKSFISPFDYVIRYTDEKGEKRTVTVNPNCVISAHLSRTKFFKPSILSKSMLKNHFNRTCIIFYKSDTYSPYFTGYGKQDKDALELLFSKDLNITARKITDPVFCVLLIGIDIDCHNGEKHVLEVEALIRHYLPNTYWEYSTGGKGRHGYLKILYRKGSFDALKIICQCMDRLFSKLNQLKTLYGFEANIDKPAGLPYKLDFVDENPYQEEWTTLYKSEKNEPFADFYGGYINPDSQIWKDYTSYLKKNTTLRVRKKCISKPLTYLENLSPEKIQTTFSKYLSDNNITFPPPTKNKKYYKITVQRAFKLPLFGAVPTEFDAGLPKMDCIKEFYQTPYYTSSELKTVSKAITNDLQAVKQGTQLPRIILSSCNLLSPSILSSQDASVGVQDEDICVADMVIPVKEGFKGSSTRSLRSLVTETHTEDPALGNTGLAVGKNPEFVPLKREEKEETNNCACTNTHYLDKKRGQSEQTNENNTIKYAKEIEWSDLKTESKELNIDQFWKTYHENKTVINNNTYEEIMTTLKNESDTMKKTALFIAAYLRKHNGKKIAVEEAEKEYVKWGLNTNPDPCSVKRLERMKSAIDYFHGNYKEDRLGFQIDWKNEKQRIVDLIQSYLPKDLIYKQGKRIKTYTTEDIGYVYYLIEQMENTHQNTVLKRSLSYKHIDELFLREFGKKCGGHKFAGIIPTLIKCGLVEKTDNYRVGLRGNGYRIIHPEKRKTG